MALSRYVLTANVTMTADTTVGERPVTGQPGHRRAGGGQRGQVRAVADDDPGRDRDLGGQHGRVRLRGEAALPGDRIGNLRAWTDGTDNNGHQALSN